MPDYFTRLYFAKGPRELDAKDIQPRMSLSVIGRSGSCGIAIFPFSDVGRDFKLIEEGSTPVIIPCEIDDDLIARARRGDVSRADWRRLSRYTVSLYDTDLKSLDDAGAIEALPIGSFLLLDETLYHDDIGLDVAWKGGDALFF